METTMKEYHKINGLYKRHREGPEKGKFIVGEFAKPEFEYLFNNEWIGTEKIDGTNIRVFWDGHNVHINGRTNNAQLHVHLIQRIQELFPSKKLEDVFGNIEVMLIGEGFGSGIQKGEKYRQSKDFVLFDAIINGYYMERNNLLDIAIKLNLEIVEIMFEGTLFNAIQMVREGFTSMIAGCDKDCQSEGLVLTPKIQLTNRFGERIITKLKTKDWR